MDRQSERVADNIDNVLNNFKEKAAQLVSTSSGKWSDLVGQRDLLKENMTKILWEFCSFFFKVVFQFSTEVREFLPFFAQENQNIQRAVSAKEQDAIQDLAKL